MSTATKPSNPWIRNPTSDLIFFSFGWILIFLLLLLFKQHMTLLILIVLITIYVHRHYTFALVYGQKEEFEKNKRTYIFLPILAVLVTFTFLYLNIFTVLVTISVVWTMYHSVAQKFGITRIYSRKAGYGIPWIEKGIIYSWFIYLFFAITVKEQGTLVGYQAGNFVMGYVGDYMPYIQKASYVFLAVAIIFTLIYIYEEFKNRHRISIAKNIFVFSILLLYAIFVYSLVLGYIVFAFSHAIEYIAFVNIFVSSKYSRNKESQSYFAKASRKPWVYSSLFSLGIIALCLIGRKLDISAFEIYIVGSSFLHYIYDGMIWKVRKPEVGQPFNLKYAST